MDKAGSRVRGEGGVTPRTLGSSEVGRRRDDRRAPGKSREDSLVYSDRCGGLGFVEISGEENWVVPGRVQGSSRAGAGQEGCGAVEGRGNGVVMGRVLDDTESGPRVGEARRVWGGPGAGAKRIARVKRRSQRGVCQAVPGIGRGKGSPRVWGGP